MNRSRITFEESLHEKSPPKDFDQIAKALWYAAKGDWESSHNIAQDLETRDGSWVHAYLHRVEGDEWNAGYWYRRANKPYPELSLDEELQQIIKEILLS